MKLKDFHKNMKKAIFRTTEAQLVAFDENPRLINLQLHQWSQKGDLVQLKRGLYMFPDPKQNMVEIAKNLLSPCYLSLEYALSFYGIIPEAVFSYTLVTPTGTRTFKTPLGIFEFRKIKHAAFTGFDNQTLMADKEKALVDYFYLNKDDFQAENGFWEESRIEVMATEVNFKKVMRYAKLFNSPKLNLLLTSFFTYAKSRETHQ